MVLKVHSSKAKEVSEILKSTKKTGPKWSPRNIAQKQTGVPEILKTTSKTKLKWSLRYIVQKQRGYPRSLKLLQKPGTIGPRDSFKLLQK